MLFLEMIGTVGTAIAPMIAVPDVNPDFSAPFVGAGLRIVNIAAALATLVLLIGAIAAGALLVFGNMSDRNKTRGWVALGGCFLGAMVLGSASALMTFASGIPLI